MVQDESSAVEHHQNERNVSGLSESCPPVLPVSTEEVNVKIVNTYKYLGLHLGNELDWFANALYKKGQGSLRRLRSFNIGLKPLPMSVMANILFFAIMC